MFRCTVRENGHVLQAERVLISNERAMQLSPLTNQLSMKGGNTALTGRPFSSQRAQLWRAVWLRAGPDRALRLLKRLRDRHILLETVLKFDAY